MSIAPALRVNGVKGLESALARGAAQTPVLIAAVVVKSATDLNSLTQMNASGRPGPNAPTGDYRGSWRVEVTARRAATGATEVSASSGTDRAQANRLEYGYVGTDSLGRHYDQPPYEHHGPAVDAIEPVFYAAMEMVAQKATSW